MINVNSTLFPQAILTIGIDLFFVFKSLVETHFCFYSVFNILLFFSFFKKLSTFDKGGREFEFRYHRPLIQPTYFFFLINSL